MKVFQIFKSNQKIVFSYFLALIDIFGQENLSGSNDHTNKQIKNIQNRIYGQYKSEFSPMPVFDLELSDAKVVSADENENSNINV